MKQHKFTDRELIAKVLEGDSNAFKTIVSNTQRLVAQIVYKMIYNREDREDLAQEVYLKVYHKLNTFHYKSKLSTWIGTITYNTCLNYLNKKKIALIDLQHNDKNNGWELIENKSINLQSNQTDAPLLSQERSEILSEAIEKLPPLYATIITLFHQEELSYQEISKITNLAEGTLKSYLFRARKKLKDQLLLTYQKDDL